MDELKKIVVLIDADNAQLVKLKPIIDEISTHGRIVVKKAYGDWKAPILKNWENELNRLAIKAEQQFAYVAGKNATDLAMVIGALDLLHTEIYDAFVLVSSDSDFTPLAIRLRESGIYVFGVGEAKTPLSFRNACDDFIFVEYLPSEGEKAEKQTVRAQRPTTKEDAKSLSESEPPDETPNIEDIHNLLRLAFDKYQDADGLAHVSSVGSYIKRAKPDFNTRAYGYAKLSELLEAFPDKYELKRHRGKGSATNVTYRCL